MLLFLMFLVTTFWKNHEEQNYTYFCKISMDSRVYSDCDKCDEISFVIVASDCHVRCNAFSKVTSSALIVTYSILIFNIHPEVKS